MSNHGGGEPNLRHIDVRQGIVAKRIGPQRYEIYRRGEYFGVVYRLEHSYLGNRWSSGVAVWPSRRDAIGDLLRGPALGYGSNHGSPSPKAPPRPEPFGKGPQRSPR